MIDVSRQMKLAIAMLFSMCLVGISHQQRFYYPTPYPPRGFLSVYFPVQDSSPLVSDGDDDVVVESRDVDFRQPAELVGQGRNRNGLQQRFFLPNFFPSVVSTTTVTSTLTTTSTLVTATISSCIPQAEFSTTLIGGAAGVANTLTAACARRRRSLYDAYALEEQGHEIISPTEPIR